jgi:hypothetical protein
MKAIANRFRRLQNANAPADPERAAVDAILEARRRRLGPHYVEPTPLPPGSFDGCRTMAERIVRARVLLMEHRGLIKGVGHEDNRPPTAEA